MADEKSGAPDGLARRGFLNSLAALAGTAPFVPGLAGALPVPAAAEEKPAKNARGYTTALARYAAAFRYEDIPPPVLQRAKDCITDTVGVILFGGQLPWSRMIVAQARRAGPGGKGVILGSGGLTVQAPSAALANGAMTHAFELDSLTSPDTGSHPGATLFTSALAIAQERGQGGRDLLAAFVAGAEVMIRVGRATKGTNEVRGFHAPGTTGPFGAAVASAHMMGFDDAHMTNALGIAGSLSAGLLEFAHAGNGAMVKRLHLGRAAESGVVAASLAADGFTGPDTVLEGEAGFLHAFCNEWDLEALTRGLGMDFATMTILMKRFATHITAHTPVEAVLDLRAENHFAPEDIASITIAGSKRMATVNNIPRPADVLIAQYSIPFCVALALYRNPIDPASFDENVAADPDILAMAARVKMEIVPGQGNGDLASTVTVALKNGRVLSRRVTDFKGTPERPLAPADIREKFQLLSKRFARAEMERLFARLQTLEEEKTLDWLSA